MHDGACKPQDSARVRMLRFYRSPLNHLDGTRKLAAIYRRREQRPDGQQGCVYLRIPTQIIPSLLISPRLSKDFGNQHAKSIDTKGPHYLPSLWPTTSIQDLFQINADHVHRLQTRTSGEKKQKQLSVPIKRLCRSLLATQNTMRGNLTGRFKYKNQRDNSLIFVAHNYITMLQYIVFSFSKDHRNNTSPCLCQRQRSPRSPSRLRSSSQRPRLTPRLPLPPTR